MQRYLSNWQSKKPVVTTLKPFHEPPDDIGAAFYPQLGPYSSRLVLSQEFSLADFHPGTRSHWQHTWIWSSKPVPVLSPCLGILLECPMKMVRAGNTNNIVKPHQLNSNLSLAWTPTEQRREPVFWARRLCAACLPLLRPFSRASKVFFPLSAFERTHFPPLPPSTTNYNIL